VLAEFLLVGLWVVVVVVVRGMGWDGEADDVGDIRSLAPASPPAWFWL